jgi:hypothetical protein
MPSSLFGETNPYVFEGPSNPPSDGDRPYNLCTQCTLHATSNPSGLCTDCMAMRHIECSQCHENTFSVLSGTMIRNDETNLICNTCYKSQKWRQCNWCEYLDHVDSKNLVVLATGEPACKACFEKKCFKCKKCLKLWHDEAYALLDHCQDCSHLLDEKATAFRIHGHSYKPNYHRFYGESKDCLYFGMELEVEALKGRKRDAAYKITQDCPEVYVVHDGSINYGFEIVTHPMTFDYFNTKFNLDAIEAMGTNKLCCSWRKTCGIHFHVSKSAFTPMHQYRFIKFLYMNQEFCEIIGQRKFNRYCANPKRSGHLAALELAYSKRQENRYEFVNMQNPATIELRFFKGNLLKDRILKNIEFVKALYDYTKNESYSKINANGFIDYVNKNCYLFKHLHKFIQARKLGDHKWVNDDNAWAFPEQPKNKFVSVSGPFTWNDNKVIEVPYPKTKHIYGYGRVYEWQDLKNKNHLARSLDTYNNFYIQEQKLTRLILTDSSKKSTWQQQLKDLYLRKNEEDLMYLASAKPFPKKPKFVKAPGDAGYFHLLSGSTKDYLNCLRQILSFVENHCQRETWVMLLQRTNASSPLSEVDFLQRVGIIYNAIPSLRLGLLSFADQLVGYSAIYNGSRHDKFFTGCGHPIQGYFYECQTINFHLLRHGIGTIETAQAEMDIGAIRRWAAAGATIAADPTITNEAMAGTNNPTARNSSMVNTGTSWTMFEAGGIIDAGSIMGDLVEPSDDSELSDDDLNSDLT